MQASLKHVLAFHQSRALTNECTNPFSAKQPLRWGLERVVRLSSGHLLQKMCHVLMIGIKCIFIHKILFDTQEGNFCDSGRFLVYFLLKTFTKKVGPGQSCLPWSENLVGLTFNFTQSESPKLQASPKCSGKEKIFLQLRQSGCLKSLQCCVWVHYLCKCAFHRWSCRIGAVEGKETCFASCPTGVSHAVLVGDILLIVGFNTAYHAQ